MSETLSAIIATSRRGRTRPALFVGLAGDAPRSPVARFTLGGVDIVELGRGPLRRREQRTDQGARVVALMLADARMSTTHARITRVGGAWVLEDRGSKNGTWVGGERITRRPLADGDAILVGHTVLVYRDSGGEDVDVDEAPPALAPGLATLSPALAERISALAKAAVSGVPIEITGETGTGKEVVARAVHALSRRAGRFVAVNCGALPGTLLEGELFGHKKGAYTGATEERPGLVRSADGGTLFLDEIAELAPSSQAALLRVLQEGEVVPLGGDRAIAVDVRVLTATHRELDRDVADGRFRADLRARLLGFAFAIPALRDRREDLAIIVAALLERLAPSRAITFSADAAMALYTYAWPLNVRELERALATALAIADHRIELDHLPAALRGHAAPAGAATSEDGELRDKLTASIARHDGNLAAVARELGKDRTQIRRWMKRFGLSRDDD